MVSAKSQCLSLGLLGPQPGPVTEPFPRKVPLHVDGTVSPSCRSQHSSLLGVECISSKPEEAARPWAAFTCTCVLQPRAFYFRVADVLGTQMSPYHWTSPNFPDVSPLSFHRAIFHSLEHKCMTKVSHIPPTHRSSCLIYMASWTCWICVVLCRMSGWPRSLRTRRAWRIEALMQTWDKTIMNSVCPTNANRVWTSFLIGFKMKTFAKSMAAYSLPEAPKILSS